MHKKVTKRIYVSSKRGRDAALEVALGGEHNDVLERAPQNLLKK